VDALPQLSILAVAVGLFTGIVILVFRATVDYILGSWILPQGSESFEALGFAERFALPVTGALLIGLGLSRLSTADRRVGVVHVMERLSRHQGHLPAKNAVVQFFGGILALISGQSGGREGPAIHLGAASASLLGQALKLPNNSMRTLVACGSAAAIAGSFNTPIAGVIFAMEVVMMEYTIGSFIPVIIAAVVTTVMTQTFFGNEPHRGARAHGFPPGDSLRRAGRSRRRLCGHGFQ
jgi:CIC family chloride channel protein